MLRNVFQCMMVFVIIAFAGNAQATVYNLSATLSGANEVPPIGTAGTGTMTGTLDDVSGTLTWNITFSGLSAAATAAHFHGPAAIGVNAVVQVTIPLGGGFPKIGSSVGLTLTQTAQIVAGNWYVNVHSTAFPGGEIRGQLSAVAAPAAAVPTVGEWGMIILSLLFLSAGMVIMRQRQAVTTGAGTLSLPDRRIPFDSALYQKALFITLGLTTIGCVAVYAVYGELALRDAIGSLISGTIAAYLVHLLMLDRS